MKKTILQCLAIFSLFLVSCTKEETKTPAQLLQRKWIANSQELLGSTVTVSNGTYIKFNDAAAGTDYEGKKQTTGAFTYTLNETGTTLTIDDHDSKGGGYGYTWTVEELNKTNLTISTNTLFGLTRIKFTGE